MHNVLLTGATGYIGGRVMKLLLTNPDTQVIALHRSTLSSEQEAAGDDAHPSSSLRWVQWDLTEMPPKGLAEEPITSVYHCAALTNFNVSEDDAQRVNIGGTQQLLDFAATVSTLQKFVFVSSLYATGKTIGHITETHDGETPAFANNYEWSKWEAESAVSEAAIEASKTIVRIPTIICDDASGVVTQFNAFHNTLRLLFHGLLSVVPGDPQVPLYFLHGRDAAQAVVDIGMSDVDGVFNACPRQERALLLGQLLDLGFDEFRKNERFRRRRILKPVLADQETFQTLNEGIQSVGGIVADAVASVQPFAEQLFLAKDVSNDRAVALSPYLDQVDMQQMISRAVAYLVGTRWGTQRQGAV